MVNNQLISFDEIIAEAFERVGTEDSRDELIFRNWIYRALRWIGPNMVNIKTECLEVCDLSIKKPCDYWSAIDMNLLDDQGHVFYYQYTENGFLESEQRNPHSHSGIGAGLYVRKNRSIKVGEDSYCFNLSSIAKELSISKAEIKYYALDLDNNGDPMVQEGNVEAVYAYIEFMYLKRMRNKTRGTRQVPQSEVKDAEDRYMRYKAMVNGSMRMPSPLAAEVMTRKWVSRIPNFKNKTRNSRISGYTTRK